MLLVLQIVTAMLVSIAMALALAHALELPGKLRLTEQTYRAVQTIYYPGFSLGGLAEPLGLISLLGLVFLTPRSSAAFWLTLASFVALAAMHGVYWLLTHPVNNFWVEGVDMSKAAARFFGAHGLDARDAAPDWRDLRNRWEYSHIVRAVLGLASQILLVTAIAL
ncbi:MAG: anthrone oxygenase family protein [Xanthobacteraceae bacterium]